MLGFTIYTIIGILVMVAIWVRYSKDAYTRVSYLEDLKLIKDNLKGVYGGSVQLITILGILMIIVGMVFWPLNILYSWYETMENNRG